MKDEPIRVRRFSSFEIKPIGNGFYDVYMNGEKMNGVTDVNIDMGADRLPSVIVRMTAESISVMLEEGDALGVK